MRKLILFAALAATALASAALVNPALAQQTYPTAAAGTRVQGTVPLTCNASGAACAPGSATNPGNTAIVQGGATSAVVTASFGDGLNPNDYGVQTNGRNSVYDGSAWQRQRGDLNGTVVQPGLSASFWYYTSGISPILSNITTAVTVKAAAGASVRNFIDACQISTTMFGASVPLAIRDGAGGTVIWAQVVPTAGWLTPVTIAFPVPLRSTANTLLEVVTPTANVSGTVTLDCQGHTGS